MSLLFLSLQDLHQIFPRLLSSIFGYDGSIGWQLKICHRTQHQTEYNAGYGFLCPTGDMFKLITKLDDGGFLYEFPIKCLPVSWFERWMDEWIDGQTGG